MDKVKYSQAPMICSAGQPCMPGSLGDAKKSFFKKKKIRNIK